MSTSSFQTGPSWSSSSPQQAQVILPGVFERGLVRFSTGVKEAWFVRVDGVRFGRLASRLWMRPEDVNADPDVKAPRARIEIFGGGSTRQFGSFGPHSYDEDGQAITFYRWDGPSPAEVPLADLPAYGIDAFGRLCDAFDTIAAAAGLVEKARPRRYGDAETLYILEPDMVVELQDGTSATVAELERIAPQLRGGADYMRCSGTFHSPERTRRDSHTIAIGRHGIGIHDFMEGVTYCRRDREPPARHDIGEALRRFSAERLGAAIDQQGEADASGGYGEAEGEARYGDEQADAQADHGAAETDHGEEEESDAQAEPPPPPERRARPLSSVPVDEDSNVAHDRGVEWLVEEMAFCRSAFHGRGGIMPIYPGGDDALVVVASMKTEMKPYDRIEITGRGTVKRISPVDTWLTLPEKVSVAGRRLRPDMPRPLFEEAGALYVNRYAPPAHPVQGGQTKTFDIFLERLVPNQIERDWLLQWLAHKIRVPWVPMVATIMVAEDFGSGRGTLGEILALILGAQFFKECEFSMLTGSSAAARFNSMFAESLFVIVNEAAEEEGHKFSVRRTAYEVLKGVVDPNGSALRRFEAKNQDAWMQRPFMSLLIATNHPDAVKLPKGDRRFAVITNGPKMTPEQRAAIRAWMAVPENIGALYRKLMALPVAASFDPYMPPTFDGKREMIDLARSPLDIAWGMAREEIRGRLFTGTQAITLMARTGMLSAPNGRSRPAT